ncbi:hypothetical protein C0J45_20305 [Silurus meridionalis]|nr:hypothetical protein C0J45_20305 [Silurus meridionalis]
MHNTQGHNCPDTTTGAALDNHVAEGVEQRSEPVKIKSLIKVEVLDGVFQKQPLNMASNSIFETFPSYQSCFTRGEFKPCGGLASDQRGSCYV